MAMLRMFAVRLLEFILTTENSHHDQYSPHFYTTMKRLWAGGQPIDDISAASSDADYVLEPEDFDLDWRRAVVPLNEFPELDFSHEEDDNRDVRFQSIRDNLKAALSEPILIGLNTGTPLPLFDGHHRIQMAREAGVRQLPAFIGVRQDFIIEIHSQSVEDVYGDQIQVGGQWYHAERIFGKPASRFSVGDMVRANSRSNTNDISWTLKTNCTRTKEKDIIDMVNQAEEVTYQEFVDAVGKEQLIEIFPEYFYDGKTIGHDPVPTYAKSVYRGDPCYYVRESGIEWVFTKA